MSVRRAFVALVMGLAALPAAAGESSWNVGGGAWLLSDYVWRGVSQTDGNPALQLELYVEHDSGFYGGVWASQVDFTSPGDENDGIGYELDPYIGWTRGFGDDLSLDLTLTRVIYPGYLEGFNYNYNELEVALGFGGHYEASVAYSDDIFNLGGKGIYYHLQGDWELVEDGIGFVAGIGHYDLEDAAGDSYQDWMVGLNFPLGDWKLEAQYTGTLGYSDALSEALDDKTLADGRFALVLSYEF